MRWSSLLAVLLAALSADPAFAQKTYVPKVMVSELTADPSFRPSTLRAINDFLSGAVHDQGFRVFTRDDVTAAIGLDKQKKLLGCTDEHCLAEIGGALGADYIVRGNLAMLDGNIAVTLSLVDTKGQSVNQVRDLVETDSPSDLIRALERLVPRLMAPVPHTPPASRAQPAAGGLVASTTPDSSGPGAGVYALVGGGITAIVAGSVLGILSLGSQSDARSLAAGGNFGDATERASTSATQGRIGVPLLAVGVAAVAVGAALWASSGTPSPQGGAGAAQ